MSDNDIHDQPISAIIGKRTRVYKEGDPLTEDYVPERVNILLSDNDEVLHVWKG